MDYTIVHLGLSDLSGPSGAAAVAAVMVSRSAPTILVVSDLGGSVAALLTAVGAADSRSADTGILDISACVGRGRRIASILYEKHLAFLVSLEPEPEALRQACDRLAELRDDLSRLLSGFRSAALRRERLVELGELFCAVCVAAAFSRSGRGAVLLESAELGRILLRAEGPAGQAEALPAIRAALRGHSAAVIPEYYVKLPGRQTARVE